MNKIDPVLTARLQEWLNTPAAKRDILAGATMFLQLSRNRALYNSVIRKPEKFHAKLEYELRKYLRIRLDGMATADIVNLEAEVMPRVEETVSDLPPISPDDEFPEATVAKGRRPDHDSLPVDIKELWDSNADRYRRIVLLFNELKAMSDAAPCDRYEKLKILADLDKTYRENLERYDNYVPTSAEASETSISDPSLESSPGFPSAVPEIPQEGSTVDPSEDPASGADVARQINAARKSVSSAKKALSELPADDPKAEVLRSRIQESIAVIRSLGGGLSDRQKSELTALGIILD